MTHISQLYVYPVKSLAGIELKKADLDPFGIQYDRHWMLVDSEGKFITQRQQPKLCQIHTQLTEEHLILKHKEKTAKVPLNSPSTGQMQVQVWNDSVIAEQEAQPVHQWLSKILQTQAYLVRMPKTAPRQNPHQSPVSFADAYPFLLCSEASLEFINQHLQKPAEMIRFRPNIVITDCQAFEEDEWAEIITPATTLLAKKKCTRCIIPTINPQTAEKDNSEILTILKRYRKQQNKVVFGQNLIYKDPTFKHSAQLKVGDPIFFK